MTAKTPLTKNQVRGFWAAWAGWALDGMDSFIYALVMVPALRDLLPRSGVLATPANLGYYGGLLFALFLVGWGLSLLWGPVADRFGRVKTLMLTIACYSLFTFLGTVATGVWHLAAFRLLAGIGIGGEWAMGGTFVAEEWPEDRRKMAAGAMHTGYYVGFFLAAIANYTIGARWGWRAMFALGGTPALLVGGAFSVWLVMLLVPNPYMPESVRMSHLVETASSNFVFGCIVGASFARPRERRRVEAVTTGA